IGNMCFKREVFKKFGHFRTDLGRKGQELTTGEETEYYYRAKKGGTKCVYFPSMSVQHAVELRKLTKNYVKKWYFHLGRFNCMMDDDYRKDASTRLLGVPRWMYRKAAGNFLNSMRLAIKGEEAESLYYYALCCSFWGFLSTRLKMNFGL